MRILNLRLTLGSSAALVLAVSTLVPTIDSNPSIDSHSIATRSRLTAVSCADSSCLALGALGVAWNPPIIEGLHENRWTIGQVVHTSLHNGYWMNMLVGFYQDKINNDAQENFEKILNSITRDEVKKFAADYFKKADLVDLIFLPAKK